MVFFLILILVGLTLMRNTREIEDLEPAITNEEWIELINLPNRNFAISRNNVFSGLTKGQARRRTGMLLEEEYLPTEQYRISMRKRKPSGRRSLPDDFNALTQYSECDNRPPRNQGDCGNCWIVSVMQTVSDRMCYVNAKQGNQNPKEYTNYNVSIQYVTSCYDRIHHESATPSSTDVCSGGFVSNAIDTLNPDCSNDPGYYCGSVHDQCFLYGPFQYNGKLYNFYMNGFSKVECPPAQTTECPNNKNYDYVNQRIYVGGYRNPLSEVNGERMQLNAEEIKREIYENGPVILGFDVYADFEAYDGGIYIHAGGKKVGGHAIECVGWGKNGTTEYWILKNSWGANWGIKVGNYKGYAFYKSGTDMLGIESSPFAPDVVACPAGKCGVDDPCAGINKCKSDLSGSVVMKVLIVILGLVVLMG